MAQAYENQRPKRQPPHVPLAGLRGALGLTLDEVCERAKQWAAEAGIADFNLTRGALSGIENGHRGASTKALAALEGALGLREGDLRTDYKPEDNDRRRAA